MLGRVPQAFSDIQYPAPAPGLDLVLPESRCLTASWPCASMPSARFSPHTKLYEFNNSPQGSARIECVNEAH